LNNCGKLFAGNLGLECNENNIYIPHYLTLYIVLYQHTMYAISLSNISIKRNFKQIARVKLKFAQYSEGDYILCMTSRYFCRSFTINESRLSDTGCLLQDAVSPHFGEKRKARR
jgi:hypothetical protein